MSKTHPQNQTQEEIVADALNEQGFLLSQVVRETTRLENPAQPREQYGWDFVEKEYPVTAVDGSQTRIDLVLRNSRKRGVHTCIECKRAHPAYKQWIFFDRDTIHGFSPIYFETFQVHRRPVSNKDDAMHMISEWSSRGMPVFNFYLEVAKKRDGRTAGYTETIETAFLQTMKGQTGLMAKILDFDTSSFLCSIPIVVTTAELFEAEFNAEHVSLKDGTIKPSDLKLKPIDFCAVNYHPNDQLSLKSDYIHYAAKTGVSDDLKRWQMRTVFIVQAGRVIHLLRALDAIFYNQT